MRRAPTAAAALAIVIHLFAPPAHAAVDLTGDWSIVTQSIVGPMTGSFHLAQNGTQLDLTFGPDGPYTGTIDPDAGTFTIPLPDTVTTVPPGVPITCSGNELVGTASADGQTMSGTHHAYFVSIHLFCQDGGGPFTGGRAGCGNGITEGDETCDDGNAIDGDCCSTDCTTAAPTGTTCDDGDACTPVDQCSAGRCDGGAPMVCQPCESCSAGGCIIAEAAGCAPALAGGKSQIVLRHKADAPERDALTWSWKNGEAMSVTDFGNPQATSYYSVCVIDRTGGVPTLRMRRTAAMDSCGSKPCWKTRPGGFSFASKSGAPEGVTAMTLAAGDVGRGKLSVKGKGASLAVPAGGFTSPVTIRLERLYSGKCWQATFSTLKVNDGTFFKAKSD